MSHRTLAGSRAIITGASGGIGRAIALELAGQGADLVVVARREDRLKDLAAQIQQQSRRCEILVGDITNDDVRRAAVERSSTVFGGLDILVNNAGVGALGPFEQARPERLRQVMEVNFFALVEMTRAALPLLKQGRRPIIVNLGSILGQRGVPNSSEYCASKFAVQGFSQSLRAELAPQGIDVLVVSPASTESEFFEHVIERQGDVSWRSRRPASAESVARAAVRAIRRGQHECFPNWTARLIAWGQRLSPRVMDFFVARPNRS